MTQEQYDQLIIVEDYLKRYIKKELQDFNFNPPKDKTEIQLEKLFNTINQYCNLNDIYNIEVTSELSHLRSREQYLSDKNRALQHICKINGINTNYTAYIKGSDY
jgi:hypothetical protein